MSKTISQTSARAIVDDVFTPAITRELWTGNYARVLPVTVQDFDMGAVLPAVFYMFRFGKRRGKGRFLDTFSDGAKTSKMAKQAANIDRVASVLAGTDNFRGFDDAVTHAVLGDLLLCYCLENNRRALGREEQVQRVVPAHYMASWVDLPEKSVNLRYVPEMLVALLANQKDDCITVSKEGKKTWFAVGRGFEENTLLRAFCQGVHQHGASLGDHNADRFSEETEVGLDQLLMIRLAQQLGEAPDKLRGKDSEKISNQKPIAKYATERFSEDIRKFVRAYSNTIPRHAFVELLESCMAVGLSTIITSTFNVLFEWKRTGQVDEHLGSMTPELLVDCSNGTNMQLRGLAEQSMDDYCRCVESVPIIFMALRLLDSVAKNDSNIKKNNVIVIPYASQWLCLLGDILFDRHNESPFVVRDFDRKAQLLSDRLDNEYPEAALILKNSDVMPNPVWRLAEALTLLQGRSNTQGNVLSLLDSAMMVNRPHGLMNKRSVSRKASGGKRDSRSVTFTDSVLEYLIHRHVLPSGKGHYAKSISFQEFLKTLQKRYGFLVDQSPKDMAVSTELLQDNRRTLERRLRDLGLLAGVNDAESMKRLRPRFEFCKDTDDVE